jgi:hypothetical protein
MEGVFDTLKMAQSVCNSLSELGHKQHYFVKVIGHAQDV